MGLRNVTGFPRFTRVGTNRGFEVEGGDGEDERRRVSVGPEDRERTYSVREQWDSEDGIDKRECPFKVKV